MRPTPSSLTPHEPAGATGVTPAAAPLPHDHHLWRNGRLWWIAITLYDAADRRHRIRRSLGTADIVKARRARDRLLARVRETGRWRIAAQVARPSVKSAGARSGVAA